MPDFSNFPVAKLALVFVVGLFVFVLFNEQVHFAKIETVVGCEGVSLDPAKVASCKTEVNTCLGLPTAEQQRACFSTAGINSGLIIPIEWRVVLFSAIVLLVLFWKNIVQAITKEDLLERDVPKELDVVLKRKIKAQIGNKQNNYLNDTVIELNIVKRNRGGIAFFSGTKVASVRGRVCVIDPRRGVVEPVKSPIESLKWFQSNVGKDLLDGRRLASLEEIVDWYLPVRPAKEKEPEKVMISSNQIDQNVQSGGGGSV